MISAVDEAAVQRALEAVEGMFREIQVGEVYEGKVVRIAPFGAFVEILPGRDGLVHVSQMAPHRVEKPEDIVSVGQTVKVRVTEVDNMGKIGLSMLFGEDRKEDSESRPQRRDFGARERSFGRGSDRGRFDRDRSPSRRGFGEGSGGRRDRRR